MERATGDDLTVDDVWEFLTGDEWEVAFALLDELGGVRAQPPAFWDALAGAADAARLERSAAWCHWRSGEARHGVVRADLTLAPAGRALRRTPFSGAGVLRPMRDIGHRTPDGEPLLDIAVVWVEFEPFLGPGERAPVRLAPLIPSRWRHLRPGDRIALHENRLVGGTAVVLEVTPPPAAARA